MKRFLWHIVLGFLAAGVLSSCGRDEAEVIPRGQLAKIYADMFVTDQWITTTSGVRLIADTSLVYEPILEKYGYTKLDYIKTVDVYLDDPERFSRVLRTTGEILDKRLKELRKLQHELAEAKARAEAMKPRIYVRPEEEFIYLFKETYVHYYDSLTFEPDSLKMIYQLVPIERNDTTYEGLVMVIDTLTIPDVSILETEEYEY